MAQKKSKKRQKPDISKAKARKPSQSGSWLKAFLVAFAIICFVRLFVYQTYTVHSSSMSASVLPGDWVLINKVAYGARAPITVLSVPFSPIRYETSSPKWFSDFIQMPYFRLPGFSRINRNDVVAINYPMDNGVPLDKKIMYLKRIVAIPGDTLLIKENQLYINKKLVVIENAQFEYRVHFKSRKISKDLIEKYAFSEGGMLTNFGEYSMFLTEKTALTLSKEKSVSTLIKEIPMAYIDLTYIFPFMPELNWTIDNYGPIIIPKKGNFIKVTPQNVYIYKTVIENYEGNKIEIKENTVLINNLPIQSYYFKNNYYFALDDNRDNPKDSRLWGFLPESHIVGKANYVLASFNPSARGSGMRWNRLLKKID